MSRFTLACAYLGFVLVMCLLDVLVFLVALKIVTAGARFIFGAAASLDWSQWLCVFAAVVIVSGLNFLGKYPFSKFVKLLDWETKNSHD